MMRLSRLAAAPRAARGFTAVEALVTVALLAILLAIGVPSMSNWLGASTSTNAAQFYAEGFTLARAQALANNSRSRLVFSENDSSGQRDWQVDVCFPISTDACAATSDRWSTLAKAATSPSSGAVETLSVHRSAASLPGTSVLTVTPNEEDVESVYFTELGWVDGSKDSVTQLDLAPPDNNTSAFLPTSVVLTLSGTVITCLTNAEDDDSRSCP